MSESYSKSISAASVVTALPLDVTTEPTPAPDAADFWRTHAWWPLAVISALLLLIGFSGADRVIAHALFFRADTGQWLGTGTGDWWAHAWLHDGGRWIVRLVGAAALAGWFASLVVARARDWRRPCGFVFMAIALSVGVVGALKSLSNVDCPWDLAEFGGDRPYVPLLGERPDYLPHARCFPGAHSSSGFALVCFYFLLRGRRRGAGAALSLACITGTAFSIGQQARGAHFVSHDIASAALVWCVQLALYARTFRSARRPACDRGGALPFRPAAGLPSSRQPAGPGTTGGRPRRSSRCGCRCRLPCPSCPPSRAA
jgi:membrane-associated PAP2 superfamily phosphatase